MMTVLHNSLRCDGDLQLMIHIHSLAKLVSMPAPLRMQTPFPAGMERDITACEGAGAGAQLARGTGAAPA